MSAYQRINRLLRETSIVVGASAVDTPVTAPFALTPADSKNIKVKVVAASVTSSEGIHARLQDSFDGGVTWEDAGTIEITGNGVFEIDYDYSEGSVGTLWPLARVTIDSGAGDAATITAVHVTQRR